MKVRPNSFNPIKNIGSIVPVQEFAIYSDAEITLAPTILNTTDQESIEIRDLEMLLIERLPQYHITGTLEHGEELNIQHDTSVCHISIFDGDKLQYRYSSDIRYYWLGSSFYDYSDSLVYFIIEFFLELYYWFGFSQEEEALYIGQDIQQIIEEHDIELTPYKC